jgi:hypothetical protein
MLNGVKQSHNTIVLYSTNGSTGSLMANSRIAFNNIIWVIKKDVAKTFPDIVITNTNEPGVPLFNQHSGVGDQSYMFKFGGRLDSMGRFEEYMP